MAGRSTKALAQRADRIDRALGVAAWILLVAGPAVGLAVRAGDDTSVDHTQLMIVITLIWVALIARLALAIWRWPARRAALIPLGVGVLLWALASATLNGTEDASTVEFPAPHEFLFLASYVGFFVFLALDVGRRNRRALKAWLDAAIFCGGIASLAAPALLLPIAASYPNGGLPLLVASIYPVLNLVLALFVVGQWALASRETSRRTVTLVAAFVVLAIADMSLVVNLSTGTYDFTIVLDIMWGASFILLVDAGCTAPTPPPRVARELPSRFLVAAFVASLAAMFLRPEGTLGIVLGIPCAVTLLATAGRLAVAQRDSRRATEALHLAQTDDLTELPNRRALMATLDVSLRDDRPLALVLLDLDAFKEVNDTLGHAAGDTLLELVAGRLREAIDPEPFIARIGGDEFALVLEGGDPVRHLEIANDVRAAILAPMEIDGVALMVSASLGIATRKAEDATGVDLLRRADIAMYEAKQAKTGVQLYDASQDEFTHQRLRMAEALRKGLAKGQLVMHYQPQVDAITQLVSGMEALIRWDHPGEGLIPPVAFLSIARRSGLMHELSEFVVRQSILDARNWQLSGFDFGVSINISPPELLGGKLLPLIYELQDRVGLPPERLTIEVTEDSFLTDPGRAREILLDVRDHGMRISIDDYGTGFSSLSYIRDLPVDEVKLDRSFVAGVLHDERSQAIVGSTIDMVHALDLTLVAEGVETSAVNAEMLALGADILQGYHISRPLPAARVAEWVNGWTVQTKQFRPL